MKNLFFLLLLTTSTITLAQKTITGTDNLGDIGKGSSENGWVLSNIKSEFKIDLKVDYKGSSQDGTLEKVYSLKGGGNITFKIDGYQYNNKFYDRNAINKIYGSTIIGAPGGVKYKIAFSDFFEPIEKTSLDGRKAPGFILESKKFSEQPNYDNLEFAYTKITQRKSEEFENKIKEYLNNNTQEKEKAKKNILEINTQDNTSIDSNQIQKASTTKNSVKREKKREKEREKQGNYNKGVENLNKIEASAKRLDASIKESEDKLNDYYEATFNSWAKQRDFNNTINSLTRIDKTSINSIIAEVKQKSRAIDNQYAQQGADTRNKIAKSGQENKYKVDANTNAALTNLGQVLAQQANQKQRRKAQQALKEEQGAAVNTLIKKFEEKIKPRRDKYLQLAALSVYPNEEDYYLGLYNYNDCLFESAYSILKGNNSCSEPTTNKPSKKHNVSGQDYYNAYKRKRNSSIQTMNIASETLLELAIEKEPNNTEWLYEKFTFDDKEFVNNTLFQLTKKVPLIARILELDSENLYYISKFREIKKEIIKKEKLELKNRDAKPWMILTNVPIFPECKISKNTIKNKKCFSDKLKNHFEKETDFKILKKNNIKRIFIALLISKKGEFTLIGIRSKQKNTIPKNVIVEIERVITLLPVLKPTIIDNEPIKIKYSLPLIIK